MQQTKSMIKIFINQKIYVNNNIFIQALLTRDIDYEYDFIIVGGGSGGAAVAARLSEVPDWKVLLVEAGPDEPTGTQIPSLFLNYLGSDIDWKYNTEPEKHACLGSKEQRCYWPRGILKFGTLQATPGLCYPKAIYFLLILVILNKIF